MGIINTQFCGKCGALSWILTNPRNGEFTLIPVTCARGISYDALSSFLRDLVRTRQSSRKPTCQTCNRNTTPMATPVINRARVNQQTIDRQSNTSPKTMSKGADARKSAHMGVPANFDEIEKSVDGIDSPFMGVESLYDVTVVADRVSPNEQILNLTFVEQSQELFEFGGRFRVAIEDLPLLLDALEAFFRRAGQPPRAVIVALIERNDADVSSVEFGFRHLFRSVN